MVRDLKISTSKKSLQGDLPTFLILPLSSLKCRPYIAAS